MPFVPISDEELKSLNSLESKRFVPISNEELKALNSSLQLASQQPAKGVTRTTTKVSATSTGNCLLPSLTKCLCRMLWFQFRRGEM